MGRGHQRHHLAIVLKHIVEQHIGLYTARDGMAYRLGHVENKQISCRLLVQLGRGVLAVAVKYRQRARLFHSLGLDALDKLPHVVLGQRVGAERPAHAVLGIDKPRLGHLRRLQSRTDLVGAEVDQRL